MRKKWMIASTVALFALMLAILFSQGAGQAQTLLADLTVIKSAEESAIAPGKVVAYTVSLSNTADVDLLVPSLVDTLPPDFEYVGLAGDSEWGEEPWDSVPPVIQWAGPITVPASDTLTLRYWIYVPNTVPLSPTPYTNTVTVSDTYEAKAGLIVGIGEAAVGKTATPTDVAPGELVTYTITFSNSGYVPLPLAMITDVLPTAATFVTMTATSDVLDAPVGVTGTITWTGPLTIPVGAGLIVEYQAAMPMISDTQNLPNLVSGQLGDGTVVTDSVEVRVSAIRPATIYLPVVTRRWAPPYFEIAKSADPTIAYNQAPGALITYEVVLSNIGTDPGTLAEIQDTLPAGFTFEAMHPDSDISDLPGGQHPNLVWTGPFVVTGESTLRLIYQVRASTVLGTHVNTATATASVGRSPDAPAEATVEIIEPILLSEKWEDPSPHWQVFDNYWRLEPYQWYVESGAGINSSAALKHTCWFGFDDYACDEEGAHDALYMYLSPESEGWVNYRLEVRAMVKEGTAQGLWFRGQYEPSDKSSRHVEGYYLTWRPTSNLIKLVRLKTEGKWAYTFHNPDELARVDYTMKKWEWYTIAVEVRGSNIKAFVDDELVLDYDDATFPMGTVGTFGYKIQDAAWDNILVTELP
jgi:uncharacterized repeat protein (TIGR01451 family)